LAIGKVETIFAAPNAYQASQIHISEALRRPYQKPTHWKSFRIEAKGAELILIFGDPQMPNEKALEYAGACERGWFTVRVPKSGGVSEGAFRSAEGVYFLGKTADGALAVRVDMFYEASVWGALRSESSSVYWARFDAL
jgi:hypothetical protein